MDKQIIDAAINIFQPVLESSVVLAAHYAKSTERDVVTVQDTQYAMRYCARHITGNTTGSLFPEIYEVSSGDETDSDDDMIEEDESKIPEFTRYTGEDELMNSINECWDTWSSWVPQSEAEIMIKNAIDSYDER
jgi:hypothetical protein